MQPSDSYVLLCCPSCVTPCYPIVHIPRFLPHYRLAVIFSLLPYHSASVCFPSPLLLMLLNARTMLGFPPLDLRTAHLISTHAMHTFFFLGYFFFLGLFFAFRVSSLSGEILPVPKYVLCYLSSPCTTDRFYVSTMCRSRSAPPFIDSLTVVVSYICVKMD